MNTWKLRFDRYLVADPVAFRMMEKLVRKGFSRQQICIALERYTNPRASRALRGVFEEFAPLKKRTKRLAGHCSNLALALKEMYGSPYGVVFPEANGMVRLADTLERAAVQLDRANHTKALSIFTEKSLWNGFVLGLLYEELNIPKSLSWDDWHPLYRVALQAHGLHDDLIGPKSLGTNHRRFLERNPLARRLFKILLGMYQPPITATPK
jgi:hypothetical protein